VQREKLLVFRALYPKIITLKRGHPVAKAVKLAVHKPPTGLDPKYHAEFRHIMEQLAELAASADVESVARLARCRVDEKETSAIIDAAGRMVTGQKGNPVKHPLTGALDALRARATRLEGELGVTAAARRRITGRRPKTAEDKETWEGLATEGLLQSFADPSWAPSAELEARMAALWPTSATAKLHAEKSGKPR
jgi:P27 family predicted phage terminase small subunit